MVHLLFIDDFGDPSQMAIMMMITREMIMKDNSSNGRREKDEKKSFQLYTHKTKFPSKERG